MNRKTAVTVSNRRAVLLYAVVSCFLFFEMAVQVSPAVMSSQLMHDLNISAFGLGIMSGMYFYTYTLMQIPSGILFDKYNPRTVIVISILVCTLGTVLFSMAHSIYSGSIARVLMGLGSAFAFVAVLVVTADLFKSRYFAIMTGITQLLAALGAMAGQMPISILLIKMGWRPTLLVLAGIGFLLAIAIWKLLKYERSSYSVHPIAIKTNLKKIIPYPQTWLIALYACLLWAPMSSVASLWGVPFLIAIDHVGQTTAAFLCSLMWLGLAIASPLLGILSTVLENKVIPLSLSAFIGAISFGLLLKFHLPVIALGILLFLSGAACAGQALSFTVVKENNNLAVRATAIAFNNMAVVISGALFQPLIGKLMGSFKNKNGLIIILICYVLAFLIALFFIKEPNKESKKESNKELNNENP